MSRQHCISLSIIVFILFVGVSVKAQSSVISAQSTDDFGTPLQAVNIEIGPVDHRFLSGQFGTMMMKGITDHDGTAWFYRAEPGYYWIRAEKEGFLPLEKTVFFIEENAFIICKLQLCPYLGSLSQLTESHFQIITRKFPSINPGYVEVEQNSVSSTLPEIMEAIPGMTLQPDSGLPRFASQRTSDVGLFIDGIPLQDPSDQRPVFFPPSSITDGVIAVKAGQDVNQQTFVGGAINIRTGNPGNQLISGMVGWSDIVRNNSFILDKSSKDMFNYWKEFDNGNIKIPDHEPQLKDRRLHLLLSSGLNNLDVIGAADWRVSNRGYASDFVNEDSLKDVNTWIKSTYSWNKKQNMITLLAGYQSDSILTEKQWSLRKYPPLLTENKNLFVALHLKQRLLSSYWYSITASSLNLDTQAGNMAENGNHPTNLPYNLGVWFADKKRAVHRLIVEGGNSTLFHAIEAGIAVNLTSTDVKEGFTVGDNIEAFDYHWITDSSDYELSLWGRDRWFLSEHLEIGLAIRWDRFNYLEQSDYLSPRIFSVWTWGKNRVTGGVERLIQSPGIGFLAEQIRFSDQIDFAIPITEPQSGFRWFGGYKRTYTKTNYFEINGYYSRLSTMVFMLPLETESGVEFNIPSMGEAGKNIGLSFLAAWELPDGMSGFNVAYAFNRTRVSWGDDIALSHVRPYPEMPWRRIYFTDSSPILVPMDNDLTHSFHIETHTLIPGIKVLAQVNYQYATGFSYTPVSDYYQNDFSIPKTIINSEKGDPAHRLDFDLSKQVRLPRNMALKFCLSLKNVFNTYQFAAVDPVSSDPVVDPYRMCINQPRTFRVGCYFYF